MKKVSAAARAKARTRTAKRAAELGRRKNIARYCAYAASEMQGEKLFADGGGESLVGAAATAHVDAETLDFLIERGERDHEALGGFGLVPSSALEHVDDDAALDLVHDLEKGRLRMVGTGAGPRLTGQRWKKFRKLQTHTAADFLAANIFGEQIDVDALLRGQDNGALDNIFELADIAGPIVIHQKLQRGGRKGAQGFVVFLAVAGEEMREQRGHIFGAGAHLRP